MATPTKTDEQSAHFAHMVCHDIQAPLRHIENYLMFIRSDMAKLTQSNESEKQQAKTEQANVDSSDRHKILDELSTNFEVVEKNCVRIRSLVDNLMMLTNLEARSLSWELVDLNEMCAELAETLLEGQSFPISATLKWGRLPKVYADPELLFQALLNLIGNGLKFTKKDQAPTVGIEVSTSLNHYEIRVRDQGVGIEQEQIKEMGKPFHRLYSSAEFQGTGLGLHITMAIMKKHGGRLEITSQKGEGSCFSLVLPMKTQESLPAVSKGH